MDVKELVGKKIRILRTKRRMTQFELAQKIGISQRSLSGIETGENFLTAETLNRVLISFGITLEDFFAVEHLKPENELIAELLDDIKSLKDIEKVRIIYKIVKAVLKD